MSSSANNVNNPLEEKKKVDLPLMFWCQNKISGKYLPENGAGFKQR